MPCYHPLTAHQRKAGGRLSFGVPYADSRRLEVPCGQCVGCRLETARQWAVRCVHESKLHEANCMATFTYDEAHLPADLSLDHRHFQLCLKRLRERVRPQSVRFYMCGEYGELHSRPHYHAILFGFSPVDRVFYRKSAAGFDCYTSAFLRDCWKLGEVYVGDVSFESAGYVARYVLKKVGSDGKRREILDVTSGEIVTRAHEYAKMSLHPGIGAGFVEKYFSDVYPRDHVVVRGVKSGVPKYYDTLLGRVSPVYLAMLKQKRVDKADAEYARLTDENWDLRFTDVRRLSVHETVKKAAIKSLRRE